MIDASQMIIFDNGFELLRGGTLHSVCDHDDIST